MAKSVHKPVVPASTGGRLVYAIGDVHGRYDLLYRMMAEIRKDLVRTEFHSQPIFIFLGDYIDRGPESKQVIQTLISIRDHAELDARFLRGNHEQAMIDFLDGVQDSDAWLLYGGVPTLASYGAVAPSFRSSDLTIPEVRAALRARLPKRHEIFLRTTSLMVEVGDYVFVHAGIRPGIALGDQVADDLLWIREEFLLSKESIERVVVHGHTPEMKPYVGERRIGLDTGAYLTGVLSAIRLFDVDRSVIQVTAAESAVKRKRFGSWRASALQRSGGGQESEALSRGESKD